MPFSLSAQFKQLNTAQKLGIFKFLFLYRFVIIFSSLSSHPLPSQLLFLIVLNNGVKKHSSEKGVVCDAVTERRIFSRKLIIINFDFHQNAELTILTRVAWVSRICVCSHTHTWIRGDLMPIAAHLVLLPQKRWNDQQ